MAELKENAEKDAAARQLEQMMSSGKKKKRRRRAVIALVLVAALGWFVVRPIFFGGKQQASAGYVNFAAEKRDMTVSISDSGALQPADSYNILGLVSGDILSADFEEGDHVDKDDLLYRIDSSDAEKSIQQAEIALENAGISYQSVVDGVDGLEPKSKIAGRVTKLYVRSGDEVQAGSPLADISDNDTMVLKVNFHQANAAAIAIGSQAVVTMNSNGEKLYGTVSTVSGATTVGTGGALLRQVEIEVSNPGGIASGAMATAVVGSYSCAESGSFSPRSFSTVYASVGGTIASVYLSEGDKVGRDQAIMSISSDSARRQIQSAELNVRSAQLALENSKDVLDNYSIKAPISGTIVEKNLKAGDKMDTVSGAKVMAVIYDMSYLTLTLDIDELDVGSIKVGQKVSIEAEALPGRTFTGYVDRVGVNGTVAAGVTTYPVKVIVEDYQDLLPGMNVTAEVIIEEASGVLCVPISAVSRGNTVLVVDHESKGDAANGVPAGYRQVEVTTGRSTDEYIEILSGVSEGEEVGVSTATTSLMEQMMMGGGGGMAVAPMD